MKKMGFMFLCAALLMTGVSLAADGGTEGEWTGEVVDVACYISKGATGPDHAGCAKSCVKGGQPMGLLIEDGTMLLLAADHSNGAAFEGLKDLAGSNAVVTGVLSENAGVQMVTVTGGKAAG